IDPPRERNPALSPTVNDAIMWAMRMRVDERPQTVRDLLDRLENLESSRPASPAPNPMSPARLPEPATPPRRPTWHPQLPYDGPFDLDVEGDQIQWPDQCACCFGVPDATLRIEYTGSGGFLGMFSETRAWDVPYCSPCAEHVGLEASMPGGNIGGALAGALIGGPIGLLVGLGSAAVSLFNVSQHQARLEGLLSTSCAAVGVAVAYRGGYENRHAFTFLNADYAHAFQRENGGVFVG
ncbi:MAG: hypothetical protein ACKVVP_24690, partial [Chloroflexota bacterium]